MDDADASGAARMEAARTVMGMMRELGAVPAQACPGLLTEHPLLAR